MSSIGPDGPPVLPTMAAWTRLPRISSIKQCHIATGKIPSIYLKDPETYCLLVLFHSLYTNEHVAVVAANDGSGSISLQKGDDYNENQIFTLISLD